MPVRKRKNTTTETATDVSVVPVKQEPLSRSSSVENVDSSRDVIAIKTEVKEEPTILETSLTNGTTNVKRKRGRPRKNAASTTEQPNLQPETDSGQQAASATSVSALDVNNDGQPRRSKVLRSRKQPSKELVTEGGSDSLASEGTRTLVGPSLFNLVRKRMGRPEVPEDEPITDSEDGEDKEEPMSASPTPAAQKTKKTAKKVTPSSPTRKSPYKSRNPVPSMQILPDVANEDHKDDEIDVCTVDPDDIAPQFEPCDVYCQWGECNILFNNRGTLDQHVAEEHLVKGLPQYVCEWASCHRNGKPFKAPYLLGLHVKQHTGSKPHTCHFPKCHKSYSRAENLKAHIRTHTGERPYACRYPGCTKAFNNPSDRAKHVHRTHSDTKAFQCVLYDCTKTYTDPSSIRKHTTSHHGNAVWLQHKEARKLYKQTKNTYKLYTDAEGNSSLVPMDELLDRNIYYEDEDGALKPRHPREATPPKGRGRKRNPFKQPRKSKKKKPTSAKTTSEESEMVALDDRETAASEHIETTADIEKAASEDNATIPESIEEAQEPEITPIDDETSQPSTSIGFASTPSSQAASEASDDQNCESETDEEEEIPSKRSRFTKMTASLLKRRHEMAVTAH